MSKTIIQTSQIFSGSSETCFKTSMDLLRRLYNRVGYFLREICIGLGVRFCVGDGPMSHGVFGKQARPEGHSDDNPLCVENEIKSH